MNAQILQASLELAVLRCSNHTQFICCFSLQVPWCFSSGKGGPDSPWSTAGQWRLASGKRQRCVQQVLRHQLHQLSQHLPYLGLGSLRSPLPSQQAGWDDASGWHCSAVAGLSMWSAGSANRKHLMDIWMWVELMNPLLWPVDNAGLWQLLDIWMQVELTNPPLWHVDNVGLNTPVGYMDPGETNESTTVTCWQCRPQYTCWIYGS